MSQKGEKEAKKLVVMGPGLSRLSRNSASTVLWSYFRFPSDCQMTPVFQVCTRRRKPSLIHVRSPDSSTNNSRASRPAASAARDSHWAQLYAAGETDKLPGVQRIPLEVSNIIQCISRQGALKILSRTRQDLLISSKRDLRSLIWFMVCSCVALRTKKNVPWYAYNTQCILVLKL